jgi:curved DNA-binding protein
MAIDYKDYYAILGVSRDATSEEIRKAYRKLARKYHPDVAKNQADAEERFKEINEANEVLGDPEKRRTYDELGANWQQARHGGFPGGPRQHAASDAGPEFHFGGTGFSDFFEHYFSGASRYGFPGGEFAGRQSARESGGRRGSDIEGDILVTLEEAMHGAVRPLSLQLADPATGHLKTHVFQVRIPPGVTNGRRIRVPGQGEPGIRGGEPGDLYLRVRHAAHPDYHTEGADIYHELDIAPWDAVLGAELRVPTLDGGVTIRIPPGSENGQQFRVRNRGLPQGKSGGRGNFHVVLRVQLPTTVSEQERIHWEQLRAVSSFDPRTQNPS